MDSAAGAATSTRRACRPASTSSRTSPCCPPGRRRGRPLDEWSLTIDGAVDEPASWTWEELLALPQETFTVDIHCVTKWSKLDTTWTGVSLDTLLADVATEADYVTAWCDGDYTTNLALEDVTDGRAWIAHTFDGEPLDPEHGGPARLLVPHLYLWKSAKWVRGLSLTDRRRARLLGGGGLPQPRRPVAGAAVLERLSGRRPIAWRDATVREVVEETRARAHARARRARLARPRRRPARRRAADRRGRLPGAALVLDRLGAGGRAASRSPSSALDDGEVSPYLVEEVRAGDGFELRGPIGGHFTWRAEHGGPLLLVGGGSGARAADGDAAPPRGAATATRTCDAARPRAAWEDVLYRDELERLARARRGRRARSRSRAARPPAGRAATRRVDAEMLRAVGPPPAPRPRVFVCGPDRVRRDRRATCSSRSATRRARSAPSASARRRA